MIAMSIRLSVCLSSEMMRLQIGQMRMWSSCHQDCYICFLPHEKLSPCEIYASGGDLLIASINMPRLLHNIINNAIFINSYSGA